MTLITKKGKLPPTPHTEWYYKEGVIALEEIHGSYGFSGAWSRKMHVRSYPTEQVKAPEVASFHFKAAKSEKAEALQPFLIHTAEMPSGGDALRSRKAIVFGPNSKMSIVKPEQSFQKNEFFRNGEAHEIYFVQEGEGTLQSEFGVLKFRKDVYIVVPKGTTYRIDLTSKSAYLLLIESRYPIEWPPHYMNSGGQAHMTAPIVETEIETPELPEPIDERGEFAIYVQHAHGTITKTTLGHHPFDVTGWEGALYPYVFDIHNHHGIAREIHTAPPMHNTFQSGTVPHNGFSLCSFVPQMEGWHPKEVPAPYAHFNVDSDEFMFFCNASYGARKGIIQDGSVTFHPGGCPHSPHGAAALKSLASRGQLTTRLAVMLDTYFESLMVTEEGWKYCDHKYPQSWNEALHNISYGPSGT